MTGTDRKVFSRAFRSHWDRENRWRIDGDMAEWSLWQSTVIYPFCFAVYIAWIGICAWVIAIYDHVSFVSTFCASLYVLWFLMVTMANTVFCCWFAVSCIVSKFPALLVLDNRGAVHPLVHINYSTPGCQCVDIFKEMDMLVLVVHCKDYRGKSLCANVIFWKYDNYII